MSSVLQVNRSEWESFLAEFSELAKKYELVLSRLDLAEGKSEGWDEKVRSQAQEGKEKLVQVRSAIEKLCDQTEETLNATR